ncbi:MAG: hypothetical protein EOM21_13220 [Gammaproteobacteria bacterium]|nr:hypothetical protein [Gammaproteobacteria bacterium]
MPISGPSWQGTRLIQGLAIGGLLLILLALFLRTLSWPSELRLPSEHITHIAGEAFQVDLRPLLPRTTRALSDNLYNLHRSDLVLLEDGARIGRPHASADEVEQDGAGAYLHWGRVLIFSTPDHSDPRTNARVYEARFQAGLSQRIQRQVFDLGALFLAIALGLGVWAWRRAILIRLRASVDHLRARRWDYLIAALVPVSLSTAALIWLPSLWNGSDSSIWLLWQLSWIPHHPPLYPVFMALLHDLTGGAAAMLRWAQWLQHAAFVLAVIYLASAYRRAWQIMTLSLLASIGAGFGWLAHGFYTEALATPLLLVCIGAWLRLHRDGLTTAVAVALVLSLLLASLTRHALLVLAGVPIADVLIRALLARARDARWVRFGELAKVLGLMIGVLIAGNLINRSVALILDAQEVSITGRAGVYRIQAAHELVPPEERAAWLAALAARAADPEVRTAFPLLAQTPDPWTGPRDAILATPALYGQHPDILMNAAFQTFLRALDPHALKQWAQELQRALLGVGSASYCPGQASCLLNGTRVSIETVFPADARTLAAMAGTGAERLESALAYRQLIDSVQVQALDLLLPLRPDRRGLWLGASLGLALLALWLRRDTGETALLLSLWLGAILYSIALTAVTVVLPRYLSPIDLLIWSSNALALIAIGEHRARGRRPRPVAPASWP